MPLHDFQQQLLQNRCMRNPGWQPSEAGTSINKQAQPDVKDVAA
jgi:hypothetical protein